VADRAALDVWRRLCTGEETKRKMSAGSKINNLSARLQSQQFAISGAFHSASARISLSLSFSFPQRKYPKEIAGSSLAELKAVASAIFMIATQVRAAAWLLTLSVRAGGILCSFNVDDEKPSSRARPPPPPAAKERSS
jgi:hypothetical protein